MLSYAADETYTFDDLLNWQFPGTSLAVLGKPVRHSISPQMHNAALAELAKTDNTYADWKYFRFEIDPERLTESLPVFYEKGFHGLNLTVPHKEIAFSYLDRIAPEAQSIGAVNTLLRTPDGYTGYNTDGYGLSRGIEIELGTQITGSPIVLLGAGGAARAAAIQAIESRCASLAIVNRNQERLARLISEIAPLARQAKIPLQAIAPQDANELPKRCILVNATSLGLKASDPTPIPPESIPAEAACFDMIYNPPETTLMKAVRAQGNRAGNGLAMLVHQGAKSLEIWTNTPPPADIMQTAATRAMQQNR